MIKDFLVSFKDSFKQKTKNPFLGTYIIVWIVKNWELPYTLFNFDKDCTLSEKVAFIENYFTEHGFISNTLLCVLFTFIVLTVTYILLALARLITNFSEKQIMPWVYKITDKNSVVLKETHDALKEENKRLEDKLDKERDAKKRLTLDVAELEQKLEDLKTLETPEDAKLLDADNEVEILLGKIKAKNLIKKYIDIVNRASSEGSWIDNEHWNKYINHFIDLGLLKYLEGNIERFKLKITETGEKVARRARLEID